MVDWNKEISFGRKQDAAEELEALEENHSPERGGPCRGAHSVEPLPAAEPEPVAELEPDSTRSRTSPRRVRC
jgi:hypothetical protein